LFDAGTRLPDSIRAKIALCKALDASVGMDGQPFFVNEIENQTAMLRRSVAQLADKTQRDLIAPRTGDDESNRIPVARFGQVLAARGIAQVAELADRGIFGLRARAGGATFPGPSGAQRQARRMRPRAVVQDFAWHKIRAGQTFPPMKAHCSACRVMNGEEHHSLFVVGGSLES